MWLDADDPSTVIPNGTTASQWSDKSGNTRNGTQGTTGNQPLIVANAMNGRSILRFYHAAVATGFNIGNSGFDGLNKSVFIMVKPSVVNTLLSMMGNSTVNLQLRLNTGGFPQITGSPALYGGTGLSSVAIGTTRPSIVNYQFGSVVDIYIDGVRTFAGINTQTAAFIINSIGFHLTFGSPFRGDMAEIIAAPLMAQTDRQIVEGYLSHKWLGSGAANYLDGAHPYKNAAPTAAPPVVPTFDSTSITFDSSSITFDRT